MILYQGALLETSSVFIKVKQKQNLVLCRSGGIGRRAGFRYLLFTQCGFKSHLLHQKRLVTFRLLISFSYNMGLETNSKSGAVCAAIGRKVRWTFR